MNTLDYAHPAQKSVLKSVVIFFPNPMLWGVLFIFDLLQLPDAYFYPLFLSIVGTTEFATIFAIYRWRKELYLFAIVAGIVWVIISSAFWLSLPYWPYPGD